MIQENSFSPINQFFNRHNKLCFL